MKKDRRPLWILLFLVLAAAAGAALYLLYFRPMNSGGGEIVLTDSVNYTYKDLEEDISQLCSRYSQVLTSETAGESVDGRKLYVLHLGSRDADSHVLVTASIHAREYLTSLIVMKQVEDFCENLETGSCRGFSYRELLDNVCFDIMPMVNPDGVTVCQMDQNALKNVKYRGMLDDCFIKEGLNLGSLYWKLWCANARGVDLDRNFDAGWEAYEDGPAGSASENYKGKSPASEPETIAILQTAEAAAPDAVISYRTPGGTVTRGYVLHAREKVEEAMKALREKAEQDTENMGSIEENLAEQEEAGQALKAAEARENALADRLKETAGYPLEAASSSCGMCDYFGEVLGIPSLSVELTAGKNAIHYPLGDENVAPTWQEAQAFLPEIAAAMTAAAQGDL